LRDAARWCIVGATGTEICDKSASETGTFQPPIHILMVHTSIRTCANRNRTSASPANDNQNKKEWQHEPGDDAGEPFE
jgi:hypothetical protein